MYLVTKTRGFKIMKECRLTESQEGRKCKEKREREGGAEGDREGRRGQRIKVEKFQHRKCGLSWRGRLERGWCRVVDGNR